MFFPARRRHLLGGVFFSAAAAAASSTAAFLTNTRPPAWPHTAATTTTPTTAAPPFDTALGAATRKKKKGSGTKKKSAPKNPALGFSRASGTWDGCEPLRKWLLDRGATIAGVNVGVVDKATGLRGVTAAVPFGRGDVLFSVPRSKCMIDEERVDQSPLGSALFPGEEEQNLVPACARNALYLLWLGRQDGEGEGKDWSPFTDALPSSADFAADGGPMELWDEEEVAEVECGHMIAEVHQRSGDLRRQYEDIIRPRWQQAADNDSDNRLHLGAPPTFEEFRHAVCVVTSRTFGEGEPNSGTSSMMVPGVDMFNHNDPPVNTRHGLAPWGDFVVYADAPIAAGDEIFLTYGMLPNRLLLAQFGFMLPGLPRHALASDTALVRVDGLFDPEAAPPRATPASEAEAERDWEAGPGPQALGALRKNTVVRNKASNKVARWQPAALARAAVAHISDGEEEANERYRALLERELGSYATTRQEDEEEQERGGCGARKGWALQFRIQAKRLLERELEALPII
eukprot:CAMPEP_0194304676 /NCGR_PEP_ID=MMETSP0171-20130528/2354_1 /TAXON_ID=218684 /ORGANISM="Corethron pennatum, Strain L29A3" /LENGTH=514 /DNA_ID=CAMNT_0039056019 /DNA_START=113 /DNA_END=1657 /DNA_ORIENTATION=+